MSRSSPLLEVLVRPLYCLILLSAAWLLWRGHHLPGGGFIAGLVAASGTLLWALAHGGRAAARRLPGGDPLRLALSGVAVALISGLPGMLGGLPFLTHLWWQTLPLSTVLLFDFGVLLCVWGAVVGYGLSLIEQNRNTAGDSSS